MNLPGVYQIFLDKWEGLQTCWIISDTHFGDEDLRRGMPNRPSDEDIVKSINSKVGKRDLLLILGDCGDIEYIKQLKGYKVLIAGNHDAGMSNYKDIFQETYSGPILIAEKLILSHEPVDVPWVFNIHGHTHHLRSDYDKRHFCVCADAINFTPINFNQFMKQGHLSRIETIHRETIDRATKRARKRGGKKIGEK